MQFTVEYPDTLPHDLGYSRDEFERDARMAMAAKLYELGRVSSGIAAHLAGITRVDFLQRLKDFATPAIALHPDEVEEDAGNA